MIVKTMLNVLTRSRSSDSERWLLLSWGEYIKGGVGVAPVRDKELRLEEVKASHTLRWSGGRGYLSRGK